MEIKALFLFVQFLCIENFSQSITIDCELYLQYCPLFDYPGARPGVFRGWIYVATTSKFSNIENRLLTGTSGETDDWTSEYGTEHTYHYMNTTNANKIVYQGDIDYIPRNLKSYFKDFRSLFIKLPRLTSVDPAVFNNIPDLEELEINESALYFLPGYLLQYNINLKVLHVQGNGDPYKSLTYIGKELMLNLKKLQWVKFNNHTCIDEVAANLKQINRLSNILQVICPVCRAKTCDDFYLVSAEKCVNTCH